MFSNSKKGSVLDLIPLLLILLGFGVSIAVGFTLLNQINTQGSLDQTPESAQMIDNATEGYLVFDFLFAAAFFGLGLTTILASALVRLKPIFFFISLILFAITIMIGAVISNVFETTVVNSPQITATAAQFPLMFWIMSNLIALLVGMGVLISIAVYTQVGRDIV